MILSRVHNTLDTIYSYVAFALYITINELLPDVVIEMNDVEDIHDHQDVSLEVVEDRPAETSPSAPPQAPKPIPTLQLPEVESPDIVPPKPSTLRSLSVSTYMESECQRHRFCTELSSKQVPDDDDICFIEEIDICLDIPSKLRQIDYPKVADAHEEDVAKVIRKKFSKLGIDEDHADIFSFLSSGELQTSYISWQARIEEAVKDESDEFWENVSTVICSFAYRSNLYS